MKLTEQKLRRMVREEISRIMQRSQIKTFVGVPGSFYIVEYPKSDDYQLEDCVYEINWEALPYQFKGGLEVDNIYGIYGPNKEREAIRAAEELIAKQRR